jgi:DNA-directed RNA polymerase subunit RPC12/RpoP
MSGSCKIKDNYAKLNIVCVVCKEEFHEETDELWEGQMIDGEYICSECLREAKRDQAYKTIT